MKKLCHGLLIDTLHCKIVPTTFSGVQDMQVRVGGLITSAYSWPNGDTLYVDDEGLIRGGDLVFFTIDKRPDQPLAGNGLLVGREIDEDGNTAPPTMTIEELIAAVGFL